MCCITTENENSAVNKSNINSCINLAVNEYDNQVTLLSFVNFLLCSLVFVLSRKVIKFLPVVFMDHLKIVDNLSDGLL